MTALNQHVLPIFFMPTGQSPTLLQSFCLWFSPQTSQRFLLERLVLSAGGVSCSLSHRHAPCCRTRSHRRPRALQDPRAGPQSGRCQENRTPCMDPPTCPQCVCPQPELRVTPAPWRPRGRRPRCQHQAQPSHLQPEAAFRSFSTFCLGSGETRRRAQDSPCRSRLPTALPSHGAGSLAVTSPTGSCACSSVRNVTAAVRSPSAAWQNERGKPAAPGSFHLPLCDTGCLRGRDRQMPPRCDPRARLTETCW